MYHRSSIEVITGWRRCPREGVRRMSSDPVQVNSEPNSGCKQLFSFVIANDWVMAWLIRLARLGNTRTCMIWLLRRCSLQEDDVYSRGMVSSPCARRVLLRRSPRRFSIGWTLFWATRGASRVTRSCHSFSSEPCTKPCLCRFVVEYCCPGTTVVWTSPVYY